MGLINFGGALQGGAMGATFGPWGAGVGALLGAFSKKPPSPPNLTGAGVSRQQYSTLPMQRRLPPPSGVMRPNTPPISGSGRMSMPRIGGGGGGGFRGRIVRVAGQVIGWAVGGLLYDQLGNVLGPAPKKHIRQKGVTGRDIKGANRVSKLIQKFGVKPKTKPTKKRR